LSGQSGVISILSQDTVLTSIEYNQLSDVHHSSFSSRYQACLSQAEAFTSSSEQGHSNVHHSRHQLELSFINLGTFQSYMLDQSLLKKLTTQSFFN